MRGRRLVSPDDARVRPTSDRTRQAIFNMLTHRDFGIGFTLQGAAVADLFAGTGALGIEALSHGARFCLFVDDSADSRALVRENVEALGLTGVLLILAAGPAARRSRALAVVLLVSGAGPLAVAAWWSIAAPVVGLLILLLGWDAIRSQSALTAHPER